MENLKEIVEIVTANKVKKIEVIGNPGDKGTKLQKLYDAIREGKVNTDEEAFALLYNDKGDKNAYHKLKHVLRERLMNTIFFIDTKTNKYSETQQAYFLCSKEFIATEILAMRNGKKTSIKLSEKLLSTTLKYDFTHLSVMLSARLSFYYAQALGDRRKFTHYNELMVDLMQLNMKEVLAESRYWDIISYYVRDKSTKKFIAPIANKYHAEVTAMKTKLSSRKVVLMTAMLKIAALMSQNDYKNVVILCKTALKELNEFPYLDITANLRITFQLIASCTHLKRYDEAKAAIERCFEIQEEGRPNWFKTHELHMTLCLHTRRYQQAWAIHQTVNAHKGFTKIPVHWQETWKIFGAWLHFLVSVNQVSLPKAESQKTFKASKFHNEVPTFSKDKRGMNVPIIIVQIANALHEKKYDAVMDRVEALSKYSTRYLDKNNNFRSSCFIRMVMEMEKQRFRKKETINKNKKLLAMMSSSPIDITDQSHDLEIIPLEDAWDYLTAYLPNEGF